ncbi:MAG: hypothetical protein RSC43_00270 [Clostridia bacterium]
MKIYLDYMHKLKSPAGEAVLNLVSQLIAADKLQVFMDDVGKWVSVCELSEYAGTPIHADSQLTAHRMELADVLLVCPQCNKELHKLFGIKANKPIPSSWTSVLDCEKMALVDYLASTGLQKFYT